MKRLFAILLWFFILASIILTAPAFAVVNSPELTSPFADVSTSDWFFSYVDEAYRRGLIVGYPDGNFYPNSYITNAEFKIICSRIDPEFEPHTIGEDNSRVYRGDAVQIIYDLGKKAGLADLAQPYAIYAFSDAWSMSDELQEAVNWAKSVGIVDGYEDGKFLPGQFLTRAEAVKLFVVYTYVAIAGPEPQGTLSTRSLDDPSGLYVSDPLYDIADPTDAS